MLKNIFISSLMVSTLLLHAAILKNDTFQKGLGSWNTPPYWPGKTELVTLNNKKYLSITSTLSRGRELGRSFSVPKQPDTFPGMQLKLEMKVKGSGSIKPGILVYSFKNGMPQYRYAKEQKLTGNFSAYSDTITLDTRYKMINVFVEVSPKGSALIENFKLYDVKPENIIIQPASNLQVVSDAKQLKPVMFKTNCPGVEFKIVQQAGKELVETRAKADTKGFVTVQPATTAPGLQTILCCAKGEAGFAYNYVETPAEVSATDALAKAVKLPAKKHILFLGDSLTDYYRGYNYVDRLCFWLEKYNPGKVTVRNAAVRGDYTTRVLDRIKGKKSTFEFAMYKNLFGQKYDIIFIFLGQNDTRCRRTQNFSKPFISPDKQEKELREILSVIQAKSNAKIVFISPSPSYVQAFEKYHRTFPKNREIYMYGKKEFVDAFDATNRKLCKEFGFDYVDILSAMRAEKDLKSLYQPDAVHLSPKGGRVITDVLLKYFGK